MEHESIVISYSNISSLTVNYYGVPKKYNMSSKRVQNDKDEQQALRAAEIVAELAPDKRTRKEAEKLIETMEDKSSPGLPKAELELVPVSYTHLTLPTILRV